MAFRDMVNDYFYGKQGSADMTVADLPATRLQLFLTVLKVRWSGLVGVNLLYLIAWLPAAAWTVFNLACLNGMQSAEAGTYVREDYMGLISSWLLVLSPCIAVTGPWKAGVAYVLRNWARDEHSFVLSDFWDAVKGNWKQALPVSVVSGLLPCMTFMAVQVYGTMAKTMPVFIVFMGIGAAAAVMWSMITMVIYTMMVTYRLRLADLIRNSLMMTVIKLPFAVLFRLATLAVPLLAAGIAWLSPAAAGYAVLGALLLYIIIVPAFNLLVEAAYANWLCETYLNPRIEGARTNIGLRPENWDDTEYRPEDDA